MIWLAWSLAGILFLSWVGHNIMLGKARRFITLRLLDDHRKGVHFADELIRRSDNVLTKLSVEHTMLQLEKTGLVRSNTNVYDKQKQRMYELTDTGREAARR